jgi:hypothetical protein
MKTPSQHLLATGKTSAVDTANGCSVQCVGQNLWRVDGYSTQSTIVRGRRRYARIRAEVWALDPRDAKAKAKALHPDLGEWAKVGLFAPYGVEDLGSVRWENFNQADRECICLAVIPRLGSGLFAYQMPAGKVFMFTVDAFGENKSVSLRGLSKLWVEAIWEAEAGNGPVPEKALWFAPEGKAALREAILINFDGGKLGLW